MDCLLMEARVPPPREKAAEISPVQPVETGSEKALLGRQREVGPAPRLYNSSFDLQQRHCVRGCKVQAREGAVSARRDSIQELQGVVAGLFQEAESAAAGRISWQTQR